MVLPVGKSIVRTLIAATVTALCAAAPASAGVLFERGYGDAAKKSGRTVEGNYREGYRPKVTAAGRRRQMRGVEVLSYGVRVGTQLDAGDGSMVFRLQRTPDPTPQGSTEFDTVFSLLDRKAKPILTAYVVWDCPEHYAGDVRSGVNLYSETMPKDAWGFWIPFHREIKPGEWFTLGFSWGADGNRIYLDGVVQDEVYKDFIGRDGRADPTAPFGPFLKGVSQLMVGADPFEGDNSPMDASLLAWFEVRDEALVPGRDVLHIESVASEKKVYGGGQEVVVTLRGSSDDEASFSIDGVAENVPMEEVDDGVYVGNMILPSDVDLPAATLRGSLEDPSTGEAANFEGATLAVDSTPPEPVPRVLADAPWPGELEVAWDPSPSPDVAEYWVYRDEGRDPRPVADPYERVRANSFVDTGVIARIEYRYVVTPVDEAGNRGPGGTVVKATALEGDGPRISGVALEPLDKPLKPGQTATITVTGQSDNVVKVDLGELAKGIVLVEQGRTGQYAGTYTVKDADVAATKTLHRTVAYMADDYGESSVAGPELPIVGLDTLDDKTPPAISKLEHDAWRVSGFSGKLVPGDVLTVTLEGEPAAYASFGVAGVVESVAMKEVKSGVYEGTYTVGWKDDGEDVPLTATLSDEAGNESTATADRTVSFDTRIRLTVTARDPLLPADRESTTRLVAKAEDANGRAVSDHELALTLSTTEEYTGVVGGGRIQDREARMEDEDNVEVRWGGVTDGFGEVAATYTAGFAAKTALVVAKDLTTGDVGAGWLNTYVASTVAIELTPRAARGAADKAILRLTADPVKLTADGRSTSRIRAWLTDLSHHPIPGERVSFSLGNENGRLRVLEATTDDRGMAEAEYRAGTAIGTVTVTASAAEYGVTASVQITLTSDAPARIDLVASEKRLPADGRSEATLSVHVTDIHDNPNQEVPVTFEVLEGSGKISDPSILTDRNGEGWVTFTAGRSSGLAVVEARHTSRPPTEDELRRVYGTVFVPRLYDRQERDRVKVDEWLAEPEDEVEKGQPLVVLTSRRGTWILAAPERGTFIRKVKFRRDRVELGDTLGYVEIASDVWEEEYAN